MIVLVMPDPPSPAGGCMKKNIIWTNGTSFDDCDELNYL